MARGIWSGVMSFGLVTIPVELYSATEAHVSRFHQFERGTTDRIRYQRVNERTGEEVEYLNIIKGADAGGGRYVMFEQEELDSVAPGRSRALDIQMFVELKEIDPIYFAKTYFLGPRDAESNKIYTLLRTAMANTNRAAIGSFVMRGKEYLAAVRAYQDVLVLETMFFADEVRDRHDQLNVVPGEAKLRPQELQMAEQLIGSMDGKWEPSDYRDSYTDRVNELIEARKNHTTLAPIEPESPKTNVLDLTKALQASIDVANRRRDKTRRDKTPTTAAAGKRKATKAPVQPDADTAQKPASGASEKLPPDKAKKAPTKKAPAKKAPAKTSAA